MDGRAGADVTAPGMTCVTAGRTGYARLDERMSDVTETGELRCAVCLLIGDATDAVTLVAGTATCADHAQVLMENPPEVAVRKARRS